MAASPPRTGVHNFVWRSVVFACVGAMTVAVASTCMTRVVWAGCLLLEGAVVVGYWPPGSALMVFSPVVGPNKTVDPARSPSL